jgi:hypothetical protein
VHVTSKPAAAHQNRTSGAFPEPDINALIRAITASASYPDTRLGRSEAVWTALRWQVVSWGCHGLLVGAAMCSAFDAAFTCAAGHDAFRADRVPTISPHSKCIGQNGFS